MTPAKTLYVAAQGEAEMADWIAAVRASIEALSTSAHRGKRGYLAKRAVVSGGNWKRRFFLLLSSDRLSCCAYYYNDETALQPKGQFTVCVLCSLVIVIYTSWQQPATGHVCRRSTSSGVGACIVHKRTHQHHGASGRPSSSPPRCRKPRGS